MKAEVKTDIPDCPGHYAIPAAVYTVSEAEWEEGRQMRRGFALKARLPGYGWISRNITTDYYNSYVADGHIIEINKEGG